MFNGQCRFTETAQVKVKILSLSLKPVMTLMRQHIKANLRGFVDVALKNENEAASPSIH